MIKYISTYETLPLRSAVLRSKLPLDQCVFSSDDIDGCFHIGYFVEKRLVSIATFFPESYPDKGYGGFRLRGMATDPDYAARGYGTKIINFAVQALTSANAAYIWCNARSSAIGFYRTLGFDIISDEFEIPDVGPHYNMIKHLTRNNTNT